MYGTERIDTERAVKVLKALADKNRMNVILKLSKGETCACRMLSELELSQPTLSHHMKVLCEAGLVIPRKEGQLVYYSLSEAAEKFIGYGIENIF